MHMQQCMHVQESPCAAILKRIRSKSEKHPVYLRVEVLQVGSAISCWIDSDGLSNRRPGQISGGGCHSDR